MPTQETKTIVNRLWNTGHFNNPAFPDTLNVQLGNLDTLELSDTVVQNAMASFQNYNGIILDDLTMQMHMRPSIADGAFGPATEQLLLKTERCGCPDYGSIDANGMMDRNIAAAFGSGSWKGCHNVGNFHCISIHVDERGMPSFLKPVWQRVKDNVSASYAELGLRIIWDDPNLKANSQITFVGSSSGWIGLAIVGRQQSCSSAIWAKFLATFGRNQSEAWLIAQWTTLVKHELGHNTGLGHSRGGVMNSYILNGLAISWRGDPSHSQLVRWFGGEPVDTPKPPTPPTTPPGTPPSSPRIILDGTVSVMIPENMPPGVHDFILVPKKVV